MEVVDPTHMQVLDKVEMDKANRICHQMAVAMADKPEMVTEAAKMRYVHVRRLSAHIVFLKMTNFIGTSEV